MVEFVKNAMANWKVSKTARNIYTLAFLMSSSASEPSTLLLKPTYIQASIIWMFTTAIKLRFIGLISLLGFFLINCYFILFDQPSYIAVLEIFSSDGHISDIENVFLKILMPILLLSLFWIFLDQSSIILLKDSFKPLNSGSLCWYQKPKTYITMCIIWLFIAYLPFLFLSRETIVMLAREDSFYEWAGFSGFFLASISYFYLFYKKKGMYKSPGLKPRRNIFFLLLGLLFFFGAGEEISWGQRIFNFSTPEVTESNIQHEFNFHNMPLFDIREVKKSDIGKVKLVSKTGLAKVFTISRLYLYFWISFCFFIPLLYISNIKIHKWLDRINFPIPPIWAGLFLITNYFIYYKLLKYLVSYPIVWPMVEMREAGSSVFLFIVALSFIVLPSRQNSYLSKSG